MKEYDKEKLHEYAKELFALCLLNDLKIDYNSKVESITVFIQFSDKYEYIGYSYLTYNLYRYKSGHAMPIWELIEKVKQL